MLELLFNFWKKSTCTSYGTPRCLINYNGTHFVNRAAGKVLSKYNVQHKIATTYHLQTNVMAKVYNRKIKSILENTVIINKKVFGD